jgi:hypothetical protein
MDALEKFLNTDVRVRPVDASLVPRRPPSIRFPGDPPVERVKPVEYNAAYYVKRLASWIWDHATNKK